jgi:integrase
MVFKRKGGKSLYFQARLKNGKFKQLATGTPSKPLAQRVSAMRESLAVEHRAWDLLEQVTTGALSIGRLCDLWTETRYSPVEMRRLLHDRNLEPLVEEWATWYLGEVRADTATHALAHVRELIPEPKPRLISEVSTSWLTQQLTAYPGKRNTRRKVHSSWSGFFGYLTGVHGFFAMNPMDLVPRPAEEGSPVRFYELDVVERIVGWQPTEARRAFLALAYGTGIEVSVALQLRRSDFNPATSEVRAARTKAHTRDRVARVADWAWPIVWAWARQHTPEAQPWRGWNRWTASDWHRETVGWDASRERGLKPLASDAAAVRCPYRCSSAATRTRKPHAYPAEVWSIHPNRCGSRSRGAADGGL